VKYRFENDDDSDSIETTIQAFIEKIAEFEISYPYSRIEFIAQTPDEEDWVEEVGVQQAIAYFAGKESMKPENLSEEAKALGFEDLSMGQLVEVIREDQTRRLDNLLNGD
jgi:hypothetical protein